MVTSKFNIVDRSDDPIYYIWLHLLTISAFFRLVQRRYIFLGERYHSVNNSQVGQLKVDFLCTVTRTKFVTSNNLSFFHIIPSWSKLLALMVDARSRGDIPKLPLPTT